MKPDRFNLDQSLAHWQRMRERLLARHPELAEDEQALLDTLEGVTSLHDLCVAVMRAADEDAMLVEGIERRIAELEARKARLQGRIEALREAVAEAMEQAGIRRIEAAEFTLSLRSGQPRVVVTDETEIPADFWRERTTRAVDRATLRDALKSGARVPGAVLANAGAPELAVRRK